VQSKNPLLYRVGIKRALKFVQNSCCHGAIYVSHLFFGGRRVKRTGPESGILIFDPKGNERGGYVTSDTADLEAFITLDSERDQVFTACANVGSGATVSVENDKHDAIALVHTNSQSWK
jgi:hypothetical protein